MAYECTTALCEGFQSGGGLSGLFFFLLIWFAVIFAIVGAIYLIFKTLKNWLAHRRRKAVADLRTKEQKMADEARIIEQEQQRRKEEAEDENRRQEHESWLKENDRLLSQGKQYGYYWVNPKAQSGLEGVGYFYYYELPDGELAKKERILKIDNLASDFTNEDLLRCKNLLERLGRSELTKEQEKLLVEINSALDDDNYLDSKEARDVKKKTKYYHHTISMAENE